MSHIPSHTACTLDVVYSYDSPNVGRDKINANFECINEVLGDLQLASSTGATMLTQGTNIVLGLTYSSTTPIYDVSTSLSPTFSTLSANSISGSTLFSGDTELSQIFVLPPTPSTQQLVSATGDTTTIGTGVPPITGYSIGTIYVTTFDTANSATGVTLNIDGQGALDVQKYDYDASGFTTLSIGEIQPTVQYFLTFDGARFQFSEIDPDSGGGTYTSPSPIPVTLGGVEAGTIFNNTPISDVFTDLFFPFLSASFSSFQINSQSTTLEVGATIAAGSKTFSWNISNSAYTINNTISIKDITGGGTTLAAGVTNLINATAITIGSVTKTTPTLHRWQIKAQRTNSTYFTRNFDVNWRWKVYYGTSSQTGLTSAQITGLTSNQLDTTVIGDTLSYSTGDYKYFCIPSTFTEPSLIKDSSTNLAIAMADTAEGYTAGTGTYKHLVVSVANQYGIAQNYKVFRSRNVLGGSINFIIS